MSAPYTPGPLCVVPPVFPLSLLRALERREAQAVAGGHLAAVGVGMVQELVGATGTAGRALEADDPSRLGAVAGRLVEDDGVARGSRQVKSFPMRRGPGPPPRTPPQRTTLFSP